jgi:hypothetical protein
VTSVLQLAPHDPKLEAYKSIIGTVEFLKMLAVAGKRGTMAHQYLEDYYRKIVRSYDVNMFVTPEDSINDRVKAIKKIQGFYDAIHSFIAYYGMMLEVKEENIEKELFFEVEVRGRKYKLSGRLDILPHKFLSKGFTIMDFKTKSRLNIHQFERDRWGMQLALYGFHSGEDIEGGTIVVLCENGKHQLVHYSLDELKYYYSRALEYVEQFYQTVEELDLKLIPNNK